VGRFLKFINSLKTACKAPRGSKPTAGFRCNQRWNRLFQNRNCWDARVKACSL